LSSSPENLGHRDQNREAIVLADTTGTPHASINSPFDIFSLDLQFYN